MTYVLQLAVEDNFSYSEQLLKSLHFMMTSYDFKNRPGLWRSGSIHVRNEETSAIVYEGPDLDLVPKLMENLVLQLNDDSDVPVLVRAGMAHLNLVMVHPFRDGNGRMARCLQTLVVAREGILAPVFCSIEEHLGRNTQSYYDILGEVGGGMWQPSGSTLPWVRFILTAHLRQARTMLRRVKESERLWDDLEKVASARGLQDRTVAALYDAAYGYRVRNSTYRAIFDEVTEATASRDLRHLMDAGLLQPNGEKRGRFYTATKELLALRQAIIDSRQVTDETDPFATAA